MARITARAENWEHAHRALENISFTAFDYASIKQGLIDYLRLHHPESFNDFIESSELIAIIEAFAHVGELLSYRYDIGARENLIPVARRRDSILRLAKLISYNASRPIPARGLVKLQTVSTTQKIFDINGNNLANKVIKWNDPYNASWKLQFIQVLETVMIDQFGLVDPSDRTQIQNNLFELYQLEHAPLATPVYKYNSRLDGRNLDMEIVPVALDELLGIVESRPEIGSRLNLLYGSDGSGDGSSGTGFFFFTKQGSLQRRRATFDGVTPNQIYPIEVPNINDTDIWLNHVDPSTDQIVDETTILDRTDSAGRSGEWVQVNSANAQNIIFNTNPNRHKYEVETLDRNQIRLNFGDGNFADVPSGTFDIWFRTSLDEDYTINQSSISHVPLSLSYVDNEGHSQTITFTFSLVNSIQNASAAESTERIRNTAPSVYYAQDRMVNGEDYNMFPLSDPSILKLRTVNRTFIGDSKYATWHEQSGQYENINKFLTNSHMFYKEYSITQQFIGTDVNQIVAQFVEPILGSIEVFTSLSYIGVPYYNIKRKFDADETDSLLEALSPPPFPSTIFMFFDSVNSKWKSFKEVEIIDEFETYGDPIITIRRGYPSEQHTTIERRGQSVVFHHNDSRFTLDVSDNVIDYNSLATLSDSIKILKANSNNNDTNMLRQDWMFKVVGWDIYDSGPNLGLPVPSSLKILPVDDTDFPSSINPLHNDDEQSAALWDILVFKQQLTTTSTMQLPRKVIGSYASSDITLLDSSNVPISFTPVIDSNGLCSSIRTTAGVNVTLFIKEYVYGFRSSVDDEYEIVASSEDVMIKYMLEHPSDPTLSIRYVGRSGLNAQWTHVAAHLHLIDPSPTNIHDMYIITKGYFLSIKQWLNSSTLHKPKAPSSFALRSTYQYLFDNKMLSDSIILHSGKFKLLFGSRAATELQGRFKVIKDPYSKLTDNQIKSNILTTCDLFFSPDRWSFGETFYFEELAAAIQEYMPNDIISVVFVPSSSNQTFGSGYDIKCREDEIFYGDVTTDIIDIVSNYTPAILKQSAVSR